MPDMPKMFLTLFILYCSFSVKAQNYEYLSERILPDKLITIGVSAYQDLASDGITSGFFKDYIAGGYIEEEIKDEAIRHLQGTNRAIVRFGGNAMAKLSLKGRDLKLTFNLDYHSFNEVLFNRDIFILYFKGNKNFEGANAALTPFVVERTDFTSFKFGIEKKYKALKFAFKLGLCSGLDYLSLNAEQGSLFTATEGRYVDLQMMLKSYNWAGAKSTLWNQNSVGVVAEGSLNIDFTDRLGLQLNLKNLGFIDWSGSIQERIVDTLYRYNGIEINNLLDSFSIHVKDAEEIESDFVRTTDGLDRSSQLPAEWSASIAWKGLNEHLYLSMGIGGIKSNISKTVYYLNSQYIFNSSLACGILCKRNAYADWDIGLHLGLSFAKTMALQVYWESFSFLGSGNQPLHLTGGASLRFCL